MTMMNINDMFQAAEAAPDENTLLGPDELPTGTTVLCEIVYSGSKIRPAKEKDNKGAAPTFNSKLRVIEPGHPQEGGEFFDAIHLSGGDFQGVINDNQHAYNKRLFAKLQGAGLSAAFFGSSPSNEAISKALVGSKVRVTMQWQKPNKDGKVFLDNTTTWEPVDGGGGGYVPSSAPVNPKGF